MATQAQPINIAENASGRPVERRLSDTDEKVDVTKTAAFKRSNDYVNKLSRSWRFQEEKEMKCNNYKRIACFAFLLIVMVTVTLLFHYYYPPIK